MAARYSDREIEELIGERKPLSQDFLSRVRLKPKLKHKEYDLTIKGEKGSDFRLIVRQSSSNFLDFSVILAYCPVNTNQFFRLCRYNGKSHEHTNKIEKETFYDFHIHTATERYQELGMREDTYAVPTDRFADLHTALQCMRDDCNFSIPEDLQHAFIQEV